MVVIAVNETGGKKQILVVDDDAIQLSTVGAILNVEYDVTTVSSGKAALEYLSGGFVPDLVLLDVLMPEMNGFEIYDKIRAIDSMGDVPVVFLTSLSAAEESRKALRKGAADYITKPYITENFKNRIRNAIRMYEYKKRDANVSGT
ncbi:MAG: response regulator [Treponema sp.]|nr:response regulator [Treponema sp.]